jgi:hypothetical protein
MLSDKCVLCFEVGNEKNDDGICAQCSKSLNELGYMKKVNKESENIISAEYAGEELEIGTNGVSILEAIGYFRQ